MKPILFNTEMVKALLEGRKTMTRRLIKPQPEFREGETGTPERCADGNWCFKIDQYTSIYDFDYKPPYQPGDILYVRETWCKGKVAYGEEPDGRCVPFISQCPGEDDIIPKELAIREGIGIEDVVWRPSIHMPKEAARIFLRVKSVRVEQLQEGFSGDTAIFALRAEGIDIGEHCRTCIDNYGRPCCNDEDTDGGSECGMLDDVLTKFVQLWDSTIPKHPNKFKSYPYYWKDNPWVWVIEFERISKEDIDHG